METPFLNGLNLKGLDVPTANSFESLTPFQDISLSSADLAYYTSEVSQEALQKEPAHKFLGCGPRAWEVTVLSCNDISLDIVYHSFRK